jgi:hypothetical protein
MGDGIQVYLMYDHSGQQIDHYLVALKFRERLEESKQTTHTVHMERFNLKKLNEVDGSIVLKSQIVSQLRKT